MQVGPVLSFYLLSVRKELSRKQILRKSRGKRSAYTWTVGKETCAVTVKVTAELSMGVPPKTTA